MATVRLYVGPVKRVTLYIVYQAINGRDARFSTTAAILFPLGGQGLGWWLERTTSRKNRRTSAAPARLLGEAGDQIPPVGHRLAPGTSSSEVRFAARWLGAEGRLRPPAGRGSPGAPRASWALPWARRCPRRFPAERCGGSHLGTQPGSHLSARSAPCPTRLRRRAGHRVVGLGSESACDIRSIRLPNSRVVILLGEG
jgi:hypothetical protein